MKRPDLPASLSRMLALTILGSLWLPYILAAEVAPSEQQLAEINTAIERIEAWLDEASQQRPDYENSLHAVETRLASISQEITTIRKGVETTTTQLNNLHQRQQQLSTQKSQQAEIIEQLLRTVYMEGSQSTLKLVLNQQDPAEAARLLYYYRHIHAHRLAQIKIYEQTLTNLRSTEIDIQNANRELIEENKELDQLLQELEAEKQARQQALANLEESIAEQDAELQKLLVDREALETLLEEVRQAVEAIPPPGSQQPFARRKGALPWPGSGPLLSRFGDRFGNGELQRQGLTVGAASGDPVRAVHGGRVVFANWLRGSGLLLILDHGDGYLSLYGHNETLTQQQGSRVNAGEVIATVGNSGGQQQTGIYFEIRYNGRPVDPLVWLEPANH